MCGRFASAQPLPAYTRSISSHLPPSHPPHPTPDMSSYHPSYNVAPHTHFPVVRRPHASDASASSAPLLLQPMQWGLVPRSSRTPSAPRPINARDDSLLASTLWHPLLASQRCILFCQGFYEWQKKPATATSVAVAAETTGPVERIAHFVGMAAEGPGRMGSDGRERQLMPLAALWDVRPASDSDAAAPSYSFAVVTTRSSARLEFLHDRMPVVLPDRRSVRLWLGLGLESESGACGWTDEVARLVRPFAGELECYRVPPEVGRVGNQSAAFILPLERRKDGVRAFFAKQTERQSHGGSADAQYREGGAERRGSAVGPEEEDGGEEAFQQDAVEVAEEVEEDVAISEAVSKLEQEEADRRYAEELQRSWQDEEPRIRAVSPSTSVVAAHEEGDGFAIPDDLSNGVEEAKPAQTTSIDAVQPPRRGSTPTRTPPPHDPPTESSPACGSSRFSPDPYDPPLSPHRPTGGYSRPNSEAGSPPRKRTKFPTREIGPVESGPLDMLLHRQREKAQAEGTSPSARVGETSPTRRRHGPRERDIRAFFARKA